ncbi:MAG: AAA family ATPase [Candidatus Helarchaeota archaeon]
MYLSKAIITNFKTFNGSFEIDFSKKITLLTGNNGTGKSNVLDAISFALGGHDDRLEGTAIELISKDFTINQRMADFCEVTLIFSDDEENEIITITRQLRVPKSGRAYSVYKLNGNNASLSEIQEVLAKYGINQNGFNMVKQGEISTKINESPESLRKLIERIAGVSQYDPKISEAEAKINNAKNVLYHIELLIEDAKNRLEKYKKSRDKALKYREIKQKINYNKALKLLSVLNRLNSKISEHDNQINERNNKIKELENQISQLDVEISEIRGQIEKERLKRTKLEQEKMRMAGASSIQIQNLNRINDEIFKKKEKIDEFKRKINTFRNESIKKLIDQRKKAEKKLSEIRELDKENKEKSRKLQLEVLKLKDRLPALEDEYKYLTLERQKIDEQIKKLEQKKNEIDKFRTEWRSKTEILSNKRESLLNRKNELEDSLNNINSKLTRMQRKSNRLRNEKNKIETFLTYSQDEMRDLFYNITEYEKQINELTEKKHELEIRLEKMIPRYSDEIQKILKLRDDSILKTVIGTPLELISDIKKDYALAIEIAGGEKLQNIVVNNYHDIEEITQKINDLNFGQISFFSLNDIKEFKELKVPADSKVLGKIIDYVMYDPKYEKLFKAIFQNTLLVVDLDTALKYSNFRCVTKDGILVEPTGEIVILNKFDSRFLLINEFYRRKIYEVKLELEELTGHYTQLRKKVTKLTTDRERSDRKRIEIVEELAQLDGRILELENQVLEINPILDKVIMDYRKLEDEYIEAVTQFENLDAELGLTIERIRELENKMAEIQLKIDNTELGNVENQIKEKQGQILSLHKKISSSEKEIARYNTEILNYNSRIAFFESQIQEYQNQIKEVEKERSELDIEREELTKLIDTQRERYDEIDNKIKEINEQLESIQKRRAKIVDKKEEIDAEIKGLIYEINELNKSKSTLLERAKNIEDKMASLGVKIDEIKEIDFKEIDLEIEKLEEELSKLGPVDPTAPEKYEEEMKKINELVEKRKTCKEELESASDLYYDLYEQKKQKFIETLDKLNKNLKYIFNKIHPKGSIELISINPQSPLESGVDIRVDMGSGVVSSTRSLSGGQNSIVAASIIFAIQRLLKKSVWYFLDEIDAHLDDQHCESLGKLLVQLSNSSQYIVTTPRKSYLRVFAQRIYSLHKKKGFTRITCIKRESYN